MRGAKPQRALEEAVQRGGAVREGERVLVACSGGPDSVALALVLAALAPAMRLDVRLAHVNHGVRASAWQDEAVVLRVAAALGLPVSVVAPKIRRRSEAAMREARYAALETIARSCGSNVVATAHHAGDQAETVLLALFRGTGPDGLAGMPPRRNLAAGIDLARPLLRVAREHLLHAVAGAGLPYAVDPSNADASLRRNAVRQALQALRPLFPRLDAAVARTAALAGEEAKPTPLAVRRREVRRLLAEQCGLRDVEFVHIEAAVRALEAGRSGRFSMGPGLSVAIEKGRLTVHQEQ